MGSAEWTRVCVGCRVLVCLVAASYGGDVMMSVGSSDAVAESVLDSASDGSGSRVEGVDGFVDVCCQNGGFCDCGLLLCVWLLTPVWTSPSSSSVVNSGAGARSR